MTSNTTPWIKARASNGSGACVEMRTHDGMIEVRDSKQHGTGPTLNFTSAEWAAWLDGAKNGEFDHLT
jgi:Domain of unknown function (DUF397)